MRRRTMQMCQSRTYVGVSRSCKPTGLFFRQLRHLAPNGFYEKRFRQFCQDHVAAGLIAARFRGLKT